jgi:hypothetical protein
MPRDGLPRYLDNNKKAVTKTVTWHILSLTMSRGRRTSEFLENFWGESCTITFKKEYISEDDNRKISAELDAYDSAKKQRRDGLP